MCNLLLLLGIGLAASSGVAGLLFGRQSNVGQRLCTAIAVVGAGAGLVGVGVFWALGESGPVVLPWAVPGGQLSIGIDALSAIFLVPIFLVSLLGNIYGLGYWKQAEHPENGRKLRTFYGSLTAGMALLVIARNGLLFLFGWEIMALSGFFLVTTEDHEPEVRVTGWIYLVATHVATLSLFALFALLRAASGSFALEQDRRRFADARHGHGDLRLCVDRLRSEGRHHAACTSGCRVRTPSRRATCRRSCRA